MSTTILEKPGSPRILGKEKVEREYVLWGTTDESVALSVARFNTPLADGSTGVLLARQDLTVVKQQGALHVWDVTVPYGIMAPPDVGLVRWTFSTGGATVKRTQSIATIAAYPVAGVTARDFQGAIGARRTGGQWEVEGVDVPVPKLDYSETWRLPISRITNAYIATLTALSGRWNAGYFRGFAPGEVLFKGAEGSGQTQGGGETATNPEITFSFSCEANAVDIPVGTITVAAKRGWDYLWVLYEDAEDGAANAIVARPECAYVEQVHYSGDFGLLGIG